LEGKNNQEIVDSIIKEIRIQHLAHRSARTLSGGELQKIILARALAQSTRLILLDEPTVHLDIKNQIEIMELLKRFNEERGITIIMVLHDLNLAAQYCKKLILMKKGRIIDIGSPREVLNIKNVREAYNIEVILKEHPVTSSIYLIPYSKSKEMHGPSGRNVHLICGGGSGSQMMKTLVEKTYNVTTGVLNVLDEDFKTAETLKIRIVEEAPFSEITNEALRRNIELIKTSDIVILTSLWIGHGNIKNLKSALKAIKLEKPLILIESSSITDRNFYGDETLNLYNEIKRDATTVKNEEEALKIIENLRAQS
jgi:iron complex transport system ATP-binding protein